MADDGFMRRGLVYRRLHDSAGPSVEQRFDLGLQWRPKSQPGALTLVIPRLVLLSPSVNKIAGEMMGGTPNWEPGVPIVNSPLSSFDVGSNHWYVMVESDIVGIVEEVAAFYARCVSQVAVDLRSLEGFVVAAELDDRRVVATREQLVAAAAASVVLDQPERGLAILESRLTSVVARRRYAGAFSFIEAQLS